MTEFISALQCCKISFDLLTDWTGTEITSALHCGKISFDLLTNWTGTELISAALKCGKFPLIY